MNMNKQLCEDIIGIEAELRSLFEEQERLTKHNDRTWDQLVWMARGYLDREWETILNKNGRFYSDSLKTFVDKDALEENDLVENHKEGLNQN